jgi:hypothetical protein
LHFAKQSTLLAINTIQNVGDIVDVPLVLLHMGVVRHEKECIGLVEGLELYFLHLLYD